MEGRVVIATYRPKEGCAQELEALVKSHLPAAVAELWRKMEELGSFSTLHSLAEGQKPFPHFEVVS